MKLKVYAYEKLSYQRENVEVMDNRVENIYIHKEVLKNRNFLKIMTRKVQTHQLRII